MTLRSDEAVLRTVGERLAGARLRRNWTQAVLAAEAGVSVPTIKRMEAGRSTQMTNFVRVLRALDLVEGLDAFLPEPRVSPLQALRSEGRRRQRASGKPQREAPRPDGGEGTDGSTWVWGDEQ